MQHSIASYGPKINQFNQYQKSKKSLFIFYGDLECSVEKNDRCENNLENTFTTKAGKHILPGFLMLRISHLQA